MSIEDTLSGSNVLLIVMFSVMSVVPATLLEAETATTQTNST